jgi:hypothetical protein
MMERKYTGEFAPVPLRRFANLVEENQTEVFDVWMHGQMKPITKLGGMPKPAARV